MNRKLYVTNVPLSWDESELEHLFKPYGEVVATTLIVEADGTSKGLGFVTMSGDDAAISAITGLNDKEFEGYRLQVWHKPPKDGWDSPRERRKLEIDI
ncbi:MAG: RNA-binding protein [Pseudomonadota bacterium]